MTSLKFEIPTFYHVFFTSVDPLIALSGAYLDYFDPDTVVRSMFLSSDPSARVIPTHQLLFHQLGGAFVMMAFLMAVMLRYTQDIGIWKIFEGGVLITDLTLFYSLWAALAAQNRLAVNELRMEEWGTIAITGFVTVVRISFLLDIGFSTKLVAKDEKAV